jgi:hypothetical protein
VAEKADRFGFAPADAPGRRKTPQNHTESRVLMSGYVELATFEEGSPLCFSADGTKLAVYSAEAKVLMIWDLRQVRRQLAAIGLDWDAPPLPPRKEARVLAAPQ